MKHFLSMVGIGLFIFSSAFAATKNASKKKDDLNRDALLIELTGRDDDKMTDVELYSEIVAAYQSQDEIGLKSRMQKFMTKHAKSSFADNVLYLAGRQALDNKNYGEALKYFSRVLAEYPNSNKVVSAQFAKAMVYKKMNLEPQARKVFREIMQKYPGSPESFRADSEMRLLN